MKITKEFLRQIIIEMMDVGNASHHDMGEASQELVGLKEDDKPRKKIRCKIKKSKSHGLP